jgi:hypothetical protein
MRELFPKFCETLPRDIRDMVYRQVLFRVLDRNIHRTAITPQKMSRYNILMEAPPTGYDGSNMSEHMLSKLAQLFSGKPPSRSIKMMYMNLTSFLCARYTMAVFPARVMCDGSS